MSKPKPKRCKRYVPKYVSNNPMTTFFGGMSDQHAGHLMVINTRNHAALAAMTTGAGTKEGWNMLTGALNMANVLCEQGIGDEYRDDVIAGREAMLAIGRRYQETGRFVFKGDELKAMNQALSVHDTQLENIRAIDIDRAAGEVQRRLRSGANVTRVVATV